MEGSRETVLCQGLETYLKQVLFKLQIQIIKNMTDIEGQYSRSYLPELALQESYSQSSFSKFLNVLYIVKCDFNECLCRPVSQMGLRVLSISTSKWILNMPLAGQNHLVSSQTEKTGEKMQKI